MDMKEKIEKEIVRMKELITDCESVMEEVPKHLRASQELVLESYKRQLAALEQELLELERAQLQNRKFNI